MKKIILLTSSLFIFINSFSQKIEGWYDYVEVGLQVGITYTTNTLETLFPDSTVIGLVPYNDTSFDAKVGSINLHNVGAILAPYYEFYDNEILLPDSCGYAVDSVGFFYYYKHYVPNSVDTLRIQFYANSNIKEVYYDSLNFSSYTVQYNSGKNASTSGNYNLETEILLTASDSTDSMGWWHKKHLKIAVPNGPLNVYPGNAVGFTVTFHPGYSHNSGDTIDHRLNPTKKLNQFIPYVILEQNKFPLHTHDRGLFSNKITRYNFLVQQWDTFFIPGDAYPNFNRFLYAQFHANGCIMGVNNITQPIYNLNIYPNPSNNSHQLSIDFELTQQEELTVTITDITGRVLKEISATDYQQGKNTIKADITGLNTGMYYVSIISSSGGRTAKPVVIN